MPEPDTEGGTDPSAPGGLCPGDVLGGRYALTDLLGSGGFGEVFRAHDRQLQRAVAVKTLRADRLDPGQAEESLGRFRREAVLLAQVKHPHITVVHDRGDYPGGAYLVMELLTGPDLQRVVRDRGPLPWPETVRLGAAAAAALAHLHAREPAVVHRDLKPGNLVLDHGVLKLCDFGISAVLSPEATHYTATGWSPPGTPAYMSPEHWNAQEVTPGWDVWSLGAVLWTLLAGGPPFDPAAGAEALRSQVLGTPAPPVTDFAPRTPPRLAALVAAMLDRDTADRPTAAEVEQNLRRLDAQGSDEHPQLPPLRAEFDKAMAEAAAGKAFRAGMRLARLREQARDLLGADHPFVAELDAQQPPLGP